MNTIIPVTIERDNSSAYINLELVKYFESYQGATRIWFIDNEALTVSGSPEKLAASIESK